MSTEGPERIRTVLVEAIRAEYGTPTGKANMVCIVISAGVLVALAIPTALEDIINGLLRAFNKPQLDVIIPGWVVPTLVIFLMVTIYICLFIVYKMEQSKKK